MQSRILLSVPNVSEGRDVALIATLGDAISRPADSMQASEHNAEGDASASAQGVRLLDTHSDADHNRSVFSVAGRPVELGEALLRLAARVVAEIDVIAPASAGQHPHVGALDVAPIVYLRPEDRGAACAEALVVAERVADELEVPVFLYGELTAQGSGVQRTRAELRRGGVAALAARMSGATDGQQLPLHPDFGPARIHPSAGATLVAARPPLVAFNLQLAPPATLSDARRIAALVREGGQNGLPGLRAMGVELTGGVAQVSMNVERPFELSLAEVVAAVSAHAPLLDAELVALAPAAAFDGFPEDLPIRGFDPARQLIEQALDG